MSIRTKFDLLGALWPGEIMGKRVRPDDPRNSPDFDGWLKANAILGSILAIGMLGMALVSLYSVGQPDKATEFSSVTRPK